MKKSRILARVFFVALMCLILPQLANAQSAAFLDLPKDHWAYSDVEFLVKQGYMEGYPDGKFNGRKVTTRYDIALVLARILRRLEEKKAGIEMASEEERAALSRLTKEFRDELGLLDVRVDSLERRMVDNENRLKNMELKLPKVNMSGFYRARSQYVIDPKTVNRDYAGDERNITEPGLYAMFQEIYLDFKGLPSNGQIETFLELKGRMAGEMTNMLVYNKAGNSSPSAYDSIDDYVKSIKNNQYIRTNRMHITSKAQNMKVRAFSGESATGIDDPMNLLTEDTDIVDPYQGIEVSGEAGSVSYQGALLKTDSNLDDWTNMVEDSTEMVAGRLVWQLPDKFSKDSLSVGTTFAEKIFDYKKRGNSNTVKGIDFNYSTDRMGKIQANAEFLTSDAYLADTSDNNKKRGMSDHGRRYDISLQNGGFTGTLKHYNFGRNFRAYMAPVWAYDVGDYGDFYPDDDLKVKDGENYGRSDFQGEKLTRFSLNYDFGEKVLAYAKNLSVEAAYLTKTWEEDPNKPKDTDGHSGRSFDFHIVSDFNDNSTFKYDFRRKMDALEGENGERQNNVELSVKLADKVNAKGRIFLKTDPDDIFKDETTGNEYEYGERIGYFELNSDITPRVFVKGSIEHMVKNTSSPKENVRVDYIGEMTYNLTPTTTFIGGLQHVDFEDSYTNSRSSIANAILFEIKRNFTKRLRGRTFYSKGVIEYKTGEKDNLDRENCYAELIYNVSKDASVRFKFGYDYPDKNRWAVTDTDNGHDFEDIHTQKTFIFEARSSF